MSELVVKDNALIQASYTLDLAEQRLILLAIIEARNSGQGITHDSLLKIHASSYAEQFGVNDKTAYTVVKDASKGLFDLSSTYAIRLYELIIQWRDNGVTQRYNIDELRQKLGVKPDQYKKMSNFKMRVLDLAIDQINTHTDITVKAEQHKLGRKITAMSFTFKPKAAPKQIAIDDGYIKMTDKQIDVFSKKLAALPELGSNAPMGASTYEYAQLIANDLADPNKQQKYIKHLSKVGYQPSKSKDK